MAESQVLLPGVCSSIWQYDNEFDNYNNGEDEDGDEDDEDEVVLSTPSTKATVWMTTMWIMTLGEHTFEINPCHLPNRSIFVPVYFWLLALDLRSVCWPSINCHWCPKMSIYGPTIVLLIFEGFKGPNRSPWMCSVVFNPIATLFNQFVVCIGES